MSKRWAANEECTICHKHDYLRPLHGDGGGGPMCCLLCIGQWHAEHGRRRKAGRIVIRALRAYEEAGGNIWRDITKLQLSVSDTYDLDPLGYMAETAHHDGEAVDLTSELLADAIRLAHPDIHPPERRDLAERTTQGLLALQPFVFPAPTPKPAEPESEWESPFPDNRDGHRSRDSDKLRFPCTGCADTIPMYYCTPCRTECEARQEEQRERGRAERRQWYLRRKQRREQRAPPSLCAACGAPFKGKRKDARFCSDICRQRTHRQLVSRLKARVSGNPTNSRDDSTGESLQ